jgi:hypothetical protein
MSRWPRHNQNAPAARGETPMAEVLAALPLARASLFPSLLTLYGDVERCGFYQIGGYRRRICALMKKLWEYEAHREAFRRVAEVDSSRFVGFLNGLMNTVNAAITDAMELLVFVRETRRLVGERSDGTDEQRAAWAAMSDGDKQKKREELKGAIPRLTANCTTANDTLELLHYTSESCSRSFLLDDVRTRCPMYPATRGSPFTAALPLTPPPPPSLRPRVPSSRAARSQTMPRSAS